MLRPALYAPMVVYAMVVACSDSTRPPDVAARIDSARVVANPNMEISALVLLGGAGDSARVRYRVAAGSGDSVTPAVPVSAAQPDTIAVLGLMPETAYELRLVVYGGEPFAIDSQVSDPLSFTTGALPADLPAYTAGGIASLPGYLVFSAAPFGLIIDGSGRVVWYKRFPPPGPSLNFMAEPTGMLVGRLATPDTTDDNPFVEIDPAGFERRQLRCAAGRNLRFHDLLLLADGSYWIMCDETRTMDLTAVGGNANAQVTGTTVQHVDPAGALLFEWSPFDHFLITDADPSLYQGGAAVNWTHGNSFDFDTDGNLLVSFRSLDEITKINAQSGAVMWRMGGRRNEFTFAGSPDPGFSRQHNLRVVGPGRFIILDNFGTGFSDSRYERYVVDAGAHTATLEQSYGSTPGVTTVIGGSVQAVDADRYLVSFGTEGRVELFDASGLKLWAIEGNPGYVFRAQRILSLYGPVPTLTR
jgi:Arylsulfotransferase (ASST)